MLRGGDLTFLSYSAEEFGVNLSPQTVPVQCPIASKTSISFGSVILKCYADSLHANWLCFKFKGAVLYFFVIRIHDCLAVTVKIASVVV